jgi:transposase, IS30 family
VALGARAPASRLEPQISGHLRAKRILSISHETIYRHVRRDRRHGGLLFQHLRFWKKQRRKIYRSRDSRGRLPGKRMIGEERPASIEQRTQIGHWEIDTMMAKYGTKPCIVTLVERKSGYLLM